MLRIAAIHVLAKIETNTSYVVIAPSQIGFDTFENPYWSP